MSRQPFWCQGPKINIKFFNLKKPYFIFNKYMYTGSHIKFKFITVKGLLIQQGKHTLF